jgi:cell wall-associated NlpC family hydrolase
MHKRFISIGVIALIMTTSNAALATMTGDQTPSSNQASAQVTLVTQVTTPPEIIGGTPVMVQNAVSGPVKTAELASGPVVKNETPEVGSVEWLAQEKADRDKLQSDAERKQAELEAEIARLEKVAKDTKNLNKVIAATKKYVGRTWYALSGSTPDAWDCSGLVMWVYGQLGYALEHRASLQKNAGDLVENPKIGDIVAFTYKGSKSAYHVGIYVGPNEMIHAGGKRGDRTEIVSISQWAKGNGNTVVTYTRIIETNN